MSPATGGAVLLAVVWFGLWVGAGLWRFIGSGAGVPGYRGGGSVGGSLAPGPVYLATGASNHPWHSWLMMYFWYEEIIIYSYSAWGVLGWGV
jgi:hypothetical protein